MTPPHTVSSVPIVSVKESCDLIQACAYDSSEVPCGCGECFASHTFKASVEPVHYCQVSLAHPSVSPGTLEELNESLRAAAVNHDVANDHSVVVQPDVVEVVHGILETTPLSVLIKTCLRYIQVAKTSFTVRLAIPEVPCSLLDVEVFEFA